MKRRLSHGCKKGQAIIEFCLIVVIMMLLTLGAIMLGQAASLSVRLASSVYQAGRMINAQGLWPVATNTEAQNKTFLGDGLNNDIYPALKGMILPANISKDGTVIFSYLTRVAVDSVTSHDELSITYQFKFPTNSTQNSKIPYTTSGTKKLVAASFFDIDALLSNQSTVVVEIYHKTDPMTARFSAVYALAKKMYSKNNTQVTPLNYIYDFAVY